MTKGSKIYIPLNILKKMLYRTLINKVMKILNYEIQDRTCMKNGICVINASKGKYIFKKVDAESHKLIPQVVKAGCFNQIKDYVSDYQKKNGPTRLGDLLGLETIATDQGFDSYQARL